MIDGTIYWGILLSVGSYIIINYIQHKTRLFIFNPLLCSTLFTILFLVIFKIDYELYNDSSRFMQYLLFLYMNRLIY